jgi:hypothetical protein
MCLVSCQHPRLLLVDRALSSLNGRWCLCRGQPEILPRGPQSRHGRHTPAGHCGLTRVRSKGCRPWALTTFLGALSGSPSTGRRTTPPSQTPPTAAADDSVTTVLMVELRHCGLTTYNTITQPDFAARLSVLHQTSPHSAPLQRPSRVLCESSSRRGGLNACTLADQQLFLLGPAMRDPQRVAHRESRCNLEVE